MGVSYEGIGPRVVKPWFRLGLYACVGVVALAFVFPSYWWLFAFLGCFGLWNLMWVTMFLKARESSRAK